MIRDVKIQKTEILSSERYPLKKVTYDYIKPDGTSQTQDREVYHRGNAIAILLYNKENKTVILTRQFRLPTYLNENASGMMLEVCAGMLDNDSPEKAAKREAEEETGYRLRKIKKIFEAYMSPGGLTELVHFFISEYSSAMKVNEGGGLESEEENIDVLELEFDKAFQMIAGNEIRDGKTIMLLQYLRIEGIL